MKKTRLIRGILKAGISKPNQKVARWQRCIANRVVSGRVGEHVSLSTKHNWYSDKILCGWIFGNVLKQRKRLRRRVRFMAPQHRPQSLIFAPQGPYRNHEA